MGELLGEYVNRIEEACGEREKKDFIVILKYNKREEAMRKILEKCKVERTFSGILTKGRYKDKDVSVFRTGKIIIKELEGRREAEVLLEELLN